jgi:hypothetical protein
LSIPLTLRNGQALDCIHPAYLEALIGLSPKALSFHFSFVAKRAGLGGIPVVLSTSSLT